MEMGYSKCEHRVADLWRNPKAVTKSRSGLWWDAPTGCTGVVCIWASRFHFFNEKVKDTSAALLSFVNFELYFIRTYEEKWQICRAAVMLQNVIVHLLEEIRASLHLSYDCILYII